MTLEAWVRPSVTLSGWRSVVTKDVDRYYLMGSSNPQNRPAAGGTFNTTNQNVFGTAGLAVNTWTHVAATYDRTTIRLYVNGVQVATGAQTAAISTSTSALTIGADSYGEYFNGLIDEVRVYNRALTVAEIQTDMATPLGGSAGPDTTPPSAPSNLTATAISATQMNLSWTASTDNVGVTAYAIERCDGAGCSAFAQVSTVSAPQVTFTDAGLTTGLSYSYRVRASDAAQNLSPYSNTSSATTPAPDVEPPSAPGLLTATAISGTQVALSWDAATDNVGVAGLSPGSVVREWVVRYSQSSIQRFSVQLSLTPVSTFRPVTVTLSELRTLPEIWARTQTWRLLRPWRRIQISWPPIRLMKARARRLGMSQVVATQARYRMPRGCPLASSERLSPSTGPTRSSRFQMLPRFI
jgi:chitodextrinase